VKFKRKKKTTSGDIVEEPLTQGKKKIWMTNSSSGYHAVELSLMEVVTEIQNKSEDQQKAMMAAAANFKEAHSRYNSCQFPKPVRLSKARGTDDDAHVFGLKGSRLPLKDYLASARAIGPLAMMKKIRNLQGKLEAGNKKI